MIKLMLIMVRNCYSMLIIVVKLNFYIMGLGDYGIWEFGNLLIY